MATRPKGRRRFLLRSAPSPGADPGALRDTVLADADRRPWWRNAVIYQVYVRSFADGNGDGIGDLAGVRARLPYLRDLGVDAIWFTPWYPSPMADGGYDVADYRDIDPMFGTLAEAEQLIDEAARTRHPGHHRRRPEPLLRPASLVPGRARRRPGSPERDRFWFRPGRGAHGELPAERLAVHLRRQRLDADAPTTARRASGTCTCSRPSSPTSTGTNDDVRRSSRTSCASGSTAAWKGSASTRPRCSSRTRRCQTSTPTAPHRLIPSRTGASCTTSTAPGARSPSRTPASESSSARSGCRTPSASRATCAPTKCTPRSTSSSLPVHGSRALRALHRLDARGARPRRRDRDVGAVESRRDAARHTVRRARTRSSSSPRRRASPRRSTSSSAPAGRGRPRC